MNEFLTELLGEGSKGKFAAAVVMALIGALLSLLLHTTTRNPLSANTPTKFSWSFLWSDNTRRVAATIVLILICIRFSREFIGAEITMWLALLIGFGNDKLAQMLKAKGVFGAEKPPSTPHDDQSVKP